MPNKYKVNAVENANEWQSQHGPMVTWTLDVTETTTGVTDVIQVNSKPSSKYKQGDEFYAEDTGKEYRGIKRYKRVPPPNGAFGAPESRSDGQSPVRALPAPHARPALDYGVAVAIVQRITGDLGVSDYGVSVFEAIIRGEVSSPLKPKTVVRWMGNDIETAGVEQPAWDELMTLCDRLTRETDVKNVKALLIATCGVQTRKDLTADKARLFIETLKTNLAALENERRSQEPEELPF